MMLVYITLEG